MSSSISKLMAFFFMIVGFTACTSTDYVLLTERKLKPIEASECRVKVLSEKPNNQNFIEVAMISTAGTRQADDESLKRSITKEACKVGANAIVLGSFIAANNLGGSSMQVLAIRLIDSTEAATH